MNDARLVIVDDDPVACDLLLAVLGDVRCGCLVAVPDAESALALAREDGGDLFIIDYRLPGMDGIALLAALREEPRTRRARLILCTAIDDRSLRPAALEAGADDFLVKPFDAAEVRTRVRNLLALGPVPAASLADELLARETEVIFRLVRVIERGERAAHAHLLLVSHVAELIARALGEPDTWCAQLRAAAPLHDVGMIHVPDFLLAKQAPLLPDELQVVRRHAEEGHAILAGSPSPVLALGAEIARAHHEWWDGTGYPRGLAGTAIPLAARIVAVADVFDALVTSRPWRDACSIEEAVTHLQSKAGRQFDPACVDAFVRVLPAVREVVARARRTAGTAGTAA